METHETEDSAPDAALTHQPRAGQVARRDFSGASLSVSSAATDALVAKARADVEARWLIAQRCRRSLDDVRQDLIAECRRPSFARAAMYARPAGKKQNEQGAWVTNLIEGLSIRFAEAAARCMGNLQPEVQTIYDDHTTRIVKVTVTDYETNVTWSRDLNVAKTVERKQLKKGQRALGERVNSYGDRVFIVEATDDEVNVKESAMVSKAARTLLLRIVPGGIQDECKAIIKQVIANANAKDPSAAKNRALDGFAALGIKPSQLIEYLGKPLEQATPDEWEELRGLYVAIRDGETSWAEALADAGEVKPATPPPQPAAATPNAQPTPSSEPTKQPEQVPTKPARARGTAALKADLKGSTPAAKEAVAIPPEPEQAPPTTNPPPDGMIEVVCSGCDALMDTLPDAPRPYLCYACRQA